MSRDIEFEEGREALVIDELKLGPCEEIETIIVKAEFQGEMKMPSHKQYYMTSINNIMPNLKVPSTLVTDLKYLFDDGLGCYDVCLVAGDEKVNCHTTILSARSPVFRSIFNSASYRFKSFIGVASIEMGKKV